MFRNRVEKKSWMPAFAGMTGVGFVLLPLLAWGQSVKDTQAVLNAAKQTAAAHKAAAAEARHQARLDAQQAALLAEEQIEAAANLRRLEAQTGDDAGRLASLQAQSAAANQALAKSEAALANLLPIMQRLSSEPAATIFATPESPADSVRGILILQEIAGEIERQAVTVRTQADAAAALLQKMMEQKKILANAVLIQQNAESALNAQIAAAQAAELADTDVAAREAADAIKGDRDIASLHAMLERLRQAEVAPAAPAQNSGTSPVAGYVVQNFGDPTLAGPATGLIYRAAPGARVVAPCGGPVLFADKFQSYGLLVIIGCSADYDFVLSGMAKLDVAAGQRLARGQPVGEMLGYDAKNPTRQPALYVELRQNGTPVDPANWLSGGGSG
jgi:septal ring factor EnvC (AmiA/AmiB activator)